MAFSNPLKDVDKDLKVGGCGLIGLAAIVVLLCLLYLGPAGTARNFESWRSQHYGANWLVIQYSSSGSVINHWELENGGISDTDNDIFFIDKEGNAVYLSGHFIIVQAENLEEAKEKYLQRTSRGLE